MAAAVGPLSYCTHRPPSGPPRGPLPRLHRLELPPRASPALSPIPPISEALSPVHETNRVNAQTFGVSQMGHRRVDHVTTRPNKTPAIRPRRRAKWWAPPPAPLEAATVTPGSGRQSLPETEVTSRAHWPLAWSVPRLG